MAAASMTQMAWLARGARARSLLGWRLAPMSRRGLAGEAGKPAVKPVAARAPPRKVETGSFQRSNMQHKPKLIVGVLAFGLGAGTLSCIAFFETSRCEGADLDADNMLYAVEPITQTKFPLTLFSYAGSGSTHWLVTRTVRCMLGLCSLERARAYSYGVYFSSEAAEKCGKCTSMEEVTQKVLPKHLCELEAERLAKREEATFIPAAKFEGRKPGMIFSRGEQGLGYYPDAYHDLEAAVETRESYPSLVLRLVMLRDVDGDHIAHGFDRTLLGRIRDAQGQRTGAGKEALRALNRLVARHGSWKKGSVLEFVRLPEGKLRVRVNGADQLELVSEALSWSLFDAYMGPKGHMNAGSRAELLERTKEVAAILHNEE